MDYRRYGKFRIKDFKHIGIIMLIYALFAIAGILVKVSLELVLIPLVGVLALLLYAVLLASEKFTLYEDKIVIKNLLGKRELILPNEFLMIMSYADMSAPFTTHYAYGDRIGILPGKYAITLLSYMSIEEVISRLHNGNLISKHTMSSVKVLFNQSDFIYSFVCDQQALNTLLDKKGVIVVPESLLSIFDVYGRAASVYVDQGY